MNWRTTSLRIRPADLRYLKQEAAAAGYLTLADFLRDAVNAALAARQRRPLTPAHPPHRPLGSRTNPHRDTPARIEWRFQQAKAAIRARRAAATDV